MLRPALAMLYRLAVGPNADHYARRFLAFERAPQARLSWNWPAFLVPPLWAAYRGLWLPALGFAVLPLLAAIAFIGLSPAFDESDVAWGTFALLLIWLVPGLIAATCADFLVYRRVRRQALAAERDAADPVQAASRAASSRSVSWLGAGIGAVAMFMVVGAVGLDLGSAYRQHAVRQQVLASMSAVHPVEEEVEANWKTARLVPRQTGAVRASAGRSAPIEDVHVSPENGRLRVRFGPSLPELAGKAILLAPVRDPRQKVRWLCVPVDIPSIFLPVECRR